MIADNNFFQLLQWGFFIMADVALVMVIVDYGIGYFKQKP
jgi:hypothetical protein